MGHHTMTAQGFKEYVFHAAVDARYLPAEALEALQTKPAKLPRWDPMWQVGCHRVGHSNVPAENAQYFGRTSSGRHVVDQHGGWGQSVDEAY